MLTQHCVLESKTIHSFILQSPWVYSFLQRFKEKVHNSSLNSLNKGSFKRSFREFLNSYMSPKWLHSNLISICFPVQKLINILLTLRKTTALTQVFGLCHIVLSHLDEQCKCCTAKHLTWVGQLRRFLEQPENIWNLSTSLYFSD